MPLRHIRWSVEHVFSSVKRITGESVVAKRKDLMFKEGAMNFVLYMVRPKVPSPTARSWNAPTRPS